MSMPQASPSVAAMAPNRAQREAAFAALQKQASTGPVAVIIQVRPTQPFQVESSLPDESAQQRQRSAIASAQDAVIQRMQGQSFAEIKRFETIPFFAVIVDSDALSLLQADEQVVSIEEDRIVPPTLAQSIPLIKASNAHAAGYTGTGVTVAVLDTGVDSSHPAFSGALVASACFSTTYAGFSSTTLCPNGQGSQIGAGASEECDSSMAGCFHGTHVAGIAVGRGPITGVAPGAKLIAIQVFSKFTNPTYCGSQQPCVLSYDSDWVRGLEYVYSLRNSMTIASANMSLGGGKYTSSCDNESPAATTIINQLRSANIATVVASGNEYYVDGIGFPACINNAISVGATTKQDGIPNFSNSSSQLSLLAPGYDIYSAAPNNQYITASGTSMAAPHVAGAWALMKQRFPANTVTQNLTALQNTGVSITDPRNNLVRKRIKLDGALQLGSATNTPTKTTTATVTATKTATATVTATRTATATGTVTATRTATLVTTNTPTSTATQTPPAQLPHIYLSMILR